jgi:hypothetical protein
MKKTARKKLCCPHCKEMDAAIMSWVHFYNNLKRKRPPDQKADAPPVQTEDAPRPETITGSEPIPERGLLQPVPATPPPPPTPTLSPDMVIFGHLQGATDVFLVQTPRDAQALWEIREHLPDRIAVIALPCPQDLKSLRIEEYSTVYATPNNR